MILSASNGWQPKKKEKRQMDTKVKGAPVAVFATRDRVEVWVSSPTGDASDSFTYHIPCRSEEQAQDVAKMWRETWEL